jgi:hypothetical protein
MKMPLNLRSTTGDFTPFIKYNAKAGRAYVRDDAGEDIETELVAVFDLQNIATGWLAYAEGEPPNYVLDGPNGERADRPSDRHKQGFVVTIFSKKLGVREFSSSAGVVIDAMKALYNDQYETADEAKAGKLPVVELTGTVPVKTKNYGTNFQPTFRIVKWVSRPPELVGNDKAQAAPKPQATKSPPPPKKPTHDAKEEF